MMQPTYEARAETKLALAMPCKKEEADWQQEKRSLRLVDDSFRKLLIVGEHTKQWSDENGIQIMSIYDFLLNWSSTEKHG